MISPSTAFFYACDENYHDMTQYSLCSLMRAAGTGLHIHFFQYGYSRPCEQLEAIAREAGHVLTVETLSLNAASEKFEESVGDGLHAHITGTAFVKPFVINQLAAKYDYIIYLDSDVLFFDQPDLSCLTGFDELAAGVLDFANFARPEFYLNCLNAELSPAYINSGVLAVNAARWKAVDFLARYRRNIRRHIEGCAYMEACATRDQCPINMTINGDLRILPLDYNVQQWAIGTRFWDAARVRHYIGSRKFLSPRIHSHDERERELLRGLEADLQIGAIDLPVKDFGLAHAMNNFRRHNTIAERTAMLEKYPVTEAVGAAQVAG
ncbi:MAG: glycosyltransferase [Henriciella sp.]|uniref:glycosyltransferase family 8 protein n=1 Tax=Henriciella sp. TaxID=1968823 RepID=UPI003C74B758